MFREMTLQEVAEVTGGSTAHASVRVRLVTSDSRRASSNSLFVALVGERFDAHAFIDQAAEAGAVAALVAQPVETTLPVVTVEDTLAALGALAAYNRRQSDAKVIAITGSQGKTSVKEMCGRILQQKAQTLLTQGNLNNAIGAPLTLLEIGPEDRYAVIELGASEPGEIAYTAELAAADIAHITNVANTHLAGFGSLDGVARAKAELWGGLRESGTALVNLDDHFAADWLENLAGKRVVGISSLGLETADYRITGSDVDDQGHTQMLVVTPQGDFTVSLPLPGRHNAANALAALALAMEAGCNRDEVCKGLLDMAPVKGRLSLSILPSGAKLLDDSYNASPASFRAAIDVLATLDGQKIMVAGDMGELGTEAEQLHKEIGEYAASHNVDTLMTTGLLSEAMTAGFGNQAKHFASKDALLQALKPLLKNGVSVLVKGSRTAAMDTLVNELNNQEA